MEKESNKKSQRKDIIFKNFLKKLTLGIARILFIVYYIFTTQNESVTGDDFD